MHKVHFIIKYLYTLVGFILISNIFNFFLNDLVLINLFTFIAYLIIIISMFLLRVDTDRKVLSYSFLLIFPYVEVVNNFDLISHARVSLIVLIALALILIYFEKVFDLKEKDRSITELIFIVLIHVVTISDMLIFNFIFSTFYIFYGFYKKRDYNTIIDGKNPIIEHSYSGNPDIKGKTAIVVDDMIASGGSMFDVIDELKKRGVSHIYIMNTFALFTEGKDKFNEYYKEGKFDGIYTTNVSYIDPSIKEEPWLHIVDCSNHLARIIYNLHEGKSISKIMRDRSYPAKVLEKKFKN